MPSHFRTIRRRIVSIPRPLAMLLVVVGIFGVAWALVVPPFQSPDAFTHYAYTESIATRHTLPGTPGRPESSSAAQAADALVGAHRIMWSTPEAKPTWNAEAVSAYRARSGSFSRSNGGGPTPSTVNPPLYYVFAAVAYLSDVGGDELDRLTIVQLWGVMLLLATTLGGWLLAGEVLGRRRLSQLIVGAVCGLQPMVTFISTSVNPDALLIGLWTFALWMGTRVVKFGARRRDVTWLGVLTGAAILTKATSYALLPPLAVALAIGWRRRESQRTFGVAHEFGPGLAAVSALILAWVLPAAASGRSVVNTVTSSPGTPAHSFTLSGFLNYLWQFYLPRLPGQSAIHLPTLALLPWPRYPGSLPLWEIWVRQGWGAFGWLDVYLPDWTYAVLAAVTGALIVAALVFVSRRGEGMRRSLGLFYAVSVLSLLGLLHITEFRSLIAGAGPVLQGRYLLPLIALLGLAAAVVVQRLPRRARGSAAALGITGLVGLQVLALATVAQAYYT